MDNKLKHALRACVVKDKDGKHYLNLFIQDSGGKELKNAANSQSQRDLDTLLLNCIEKKDGVVGLNMVVDM